MSDNEQPESVPFPVDLPEDAKAMLDVLISNAEIIPPEARKREIPYIAMAVAMGAHVFENHQGKENVFGVLAGKRYVAVSEQDMAIVRAISKNISISTPEVRFVSPEDVLESYHLAVKLYERMTDDRSGKHGIFMLKDEGGCGYWRMTLPARHMDTEDCFIDISSAITKFEYLLEYDTIYVQRLHDWESYYILEKLKRAGKRIVYDIDDDIFSIENSNPAAKFFSRDEQIAARACMSLADVITTSTEFLRYKLHQITGISPVLIRNSLDTRDGWQPLEGIGSPDGVQRIFWQGGASHEEDWNECMEAVGEVMLERPNVRLTILGYLPKFISHSHESSVWRGRVEYTGFKSPETYFEMVKHVRAEVGLAPVKECDFNRSKSAIKWLEYSLIGIPTVASDTSPYSDVIEDGHTGMLCSTKDEWKNAIKTLLDSKSIRTKLVSESRKKACAEYDVRESARQWKAVLVS